MHASLPPSSLLQTRRPCLLCLLCLLTLLLGVFSPAAAASGSPWEEVEAGLDVGVFPVKNIQGNTAEAVIIRIDPMLFSFVILTASTPGEQPRTLREWALAHHLVAAINAGMYREDGITHTGYLRVGSLLNNSRIVEKFGAFFVSEPDLDNTLPPAAVLDRDADPWETLLPRYEMAVQNYRLIDSSRHVRWLEDTMAHGLSAIGCDGQGRILFIHCRETLRCSDFAAQLLALPIDVRQTMYVEGGTQAGMLLNVGRDFRLWEGKGSFWNVGSFDARLPNVIGVRRR